MSRRRLLTVFALFGAAPALATEAAVRASATFATPVSSPQTSYFGAGFELAGGAQLSLGRFVAAGLELSYLFVSRRADSPLAGPGSALWVGGFVRAHTPFQGAFVAPWLELGLAFVRTGDLNRPGLRAAIGAFFMLGPLRLGPKVELQQIFRITNEASFETRDGTFVSIGLAAELPFYDTAPRPSADPLPPPPPPPPPAPAPVAAPPAAPAPGSSIPPPEPDADDDLVPDRVDLCPTVKGIPSEGGCPVYKEVRSTEDRIEILQKIFFASGKAAILPRSFALLDEVVRATKDRGEICVVIGGHTDAMGDLFANMSLSDGRAAAVREYLVQHGVPAQRLTSKGYGPTRPIDDNKTPAGREKNRRVEFVIVPCAVR